jgi:hypothetical protein
MNKFNKEENTFAHQKGGSRCVSTKHSTACAVIYIRQKSFFTRGEEFVLIHQVMGYEPMINKRVSSVSTQLNIVVVQQLYPQHIKEIRLSVLILSSKYEIPVCHCGR